MPRSQAYRAFQGSKRAGRVADADRAVVDHERHKLRKVRLLAQRLTSIYELDAYLTKVDDVERRAAIRTLILTFRPDLKVTRTR